MFCDKCIFLSYYRDMGATVPFCSREKDFMTAINTFNKSDKECTCDFYITKDYIKSLQNLGIIKKNILS